MSIKSKLQGFVLPRHTDFFKQLLHQSESTTAIIVALSGFYLHDPSEKTDAIFELITKAKQLRTDHLQQLNNSLITPIDKEAISRVYVHLHWISLSVKHLVVEMDAYRIYSLKDYALLLQLLQKASRDLTKAIGLIHKKQYADIMNEVNSVIHTDNLLIKEYAAQMVLLFQEDDIHMILKNREILAQLKEICKRIHMCANQVEDIVFKMH